MDVNLNIEGAIKMKQQTEVLETCELCLKETSATYHNLNVGIIGAALCPECYKISQRDSFKKELAEIDENLIRHDLHVVDRGDHFKRRKEIYELLYPETKREATLKQNRSAESAERTEPSFVEDTANKTGVSSRVIHEEIQISRNLSPEIKKQVKEADLSKTDILKVARMQPEKQKQVMDKVIETKATPKCRVCGCDLKSSNWSESRQKNRQKICMDCNNSKIRSSHEKHNTKPYRECPRFDKCNSNQCPLDTSYPNMYVDEEDREQKCTMEKNVRIRISANYPGILKFGGLKQREFTAKQNYDKLTDIQKEEQRIRLKELRDKIKPNIIVVSNTSHEIGVNTLRNTVQGLNGVKV